MKWNTKWKTRNGGQDVRSRDHRVVSLTGLTLSLVSSLYCLVWYLKESGLQLHKVEIRQQLKQVLGDHRELTDAFTGEILLTEENTATQARLLQYMATPDKQRISLPHAMKNCPLINRNKKSQASERGSMSRKIIDKSESPAVNTNVSTPLMFRRGEVVEFPQENLSVKLSQVPNSPDVVNLANNFPAQIFEPGSSNNTTKAEDQLRILSLAVCIKEDCSNSCCSMNSSNYGSD